MDAWRVEVRVRDTLADPRGRHAAGALQGAGFDPRGPVRAVAGYLLPGTLDPAQVRRIAAELCTDPITESCELLPPRAAGAAHPGLLVTVQPRPGVMDPVAGTLARAARELGIEVPRAGTYHSYLLSGAGPGDRERLLEVARKALANEVVHRVLLDERPATLPDEGHAPPFRRIDVPLRTADEAGLDQIQRQGGLSLTVAEMRAIQEHFRGLGRDPSDVELETLAQTWSEHCKHKTLTGDIEFEGRVIHNLLKSTIFQVTQELARPWCLSVFKDNAGVVAFDDELAVCIKVETHNHPSAIEPFGGAGTGVGGVIRDILGTGLGARPIANLDVFCLAPPDLPEDQVPKGCLHPRRVLTGVVAGVRDYGNPMGIPTVNGAIHFDPDFVGNPLVYCGTVGILPRDKVHKAARAGDLVVVAGGRTGRDGIHGATFSSVELHEESETISSGAVQIGDPITEKKVLDAVLRARDEGLFTAVTDCGAGGLSSAVGEMGEALGAEVDLDKVPLKYAGLTYAEVWISEAQERMVLAVPPEKLPRLRELFAEEDSELTVIGTFTGNHRLVLRSGGTVVADLDMEFLHHGVPRLVRKAEWVPPVLSDPELPEPRSLGAALRACLADFSVASKEWVVRQYDHEVQAGTAGKPLVGARHDGPGDGAVLAPRLGSRRGVVLANGLNPRYSRIDPAAMAECALDEALRNVVACGGDPQRTAVLDNYCWGNTSKPDRLGGLVRATLALQELAMVYGTPFVSGKDSLNNEFRVANRSIAIPGCILVTALSVIPDVARTVSSDFKAAGNAVYLVGTTRRELGGSVWWKTQGHLGRSVPRVRASEGKAALDAVARAIQSHAVAACHDLAEGGLGVAAAEMAMGGRLGVLLDLREVPHGDLTRDDQLLFSESQSRFLIECRKGRERDLEANLEGAVFRKVGVTTGDPRVRVVGRSGREVVDEPVEALLRAWQTPLAFDGVPA